MFTHCSSSTSRTPPLTRQTTRALWQSDTRSFITWNTIAQDGASVCCCSPSVQEHHSPQQSLSHPESRHRKGRLKTSKRMKTMQTAAVPPLTLAPAAPDSPLAPSKPGWPYRPRDRPRQYSRMMQNEWTRYLASADRNCKTHSVSFDSRKSGSSGESTSSLYFRHTTFPSGMNPSLLPSTSFVVNFAPVLLNKPEALQVHVRQLFRVYQPPPAEKQTFQVFLCATCPRRGPSVPPSGNPCTVPWRGFI